MSLKRITREFGVNFYVLEYDKMRGGFEAPKIIRYMKTKDNYIDFDVTDYPFKKPYIVGSNFIQSSHENYGVLQKNYNSFLNYRLASMDFKDTEEEKHNTYCFHCRSIFSCYSEWSPCYSFYYVLKQMRNLNVFISSAIKLEVLKRNYIGIPEDIIHYIIKFLSMPIDEIYKIKLCHKDRLKIV